MRFALLAACLVAIACGRDTPDVHTDFPDLRPGPVAGASATSSTSVAAPGRPECPATGRWTACAIIERLDRAGLAPQLDSTATPTEPPLTAKGMLVRISRSEAEVYLYEDASARRRDEARIEKARYLDYAEAVSMQTLPTLIANSNVIVILHSRSDHQRERVGDAITAGPPSKKP